MSFPYNLPNINCTFFKPGLTSKQYFTLSQIRKSYLSKQYSMYHTPMAKYIKYKKKKKLYHELYIKNKFIYYITFIWKLFSKYCRKHLLGEVLSISSNCLIIYILHNTGLLNIIYNFINKKILKKDI